jgi:hypothetical protein
MRRCRRALRLCFGFAFAVWAPVPRAAEERDGDGASREGADGEAVADRERRADTAIASDPRSGPGRSAEAWRGCRIDLDRPFWRPNASYSLGTDPPSSESAGGGTAGHVAGPPRGWARLSAR